MDSKAQTHGKKKILHRINTNKKIDKNNRYYYYLEYYYYAR